MPYSIAGLPLHPLLVHATVVVVPAAALSVLLAAVWPRFRRWAGPLPLGAGGGRTRSSTRCRPRAVSRWSSQVGRQRPDREALRARRRPAAVDDRPRRDGGRSLPLAPAREPSRRRRRRRGAAPRSWVPVAISVLAVVAALGTSVQVVLIGHSGAKAAWSKVARHSRLQPVLRRPLSRRGCSLCWRDGSSARDCSWSRTTPSWPRC